MNKLLPILIALLFSACNVTTNNNTPQAKTGTAYRAFYPRTAAKVAALTVLQYVNFIHHRKIGQVKYALI